jgi:hypothetical protein
VVVGALLTGELNHALQVRGERREVRAVVRLMRARHVSDDDWDAVALGYGEATVLTVLVDEAHVDPRCRDDAQRALTCIGAA